MKYTLLFLLLLGSLNVVVAQTDKEIAQVYIKRANAAMEKIDYPGAKDFFEKAMRYSDTITSSNVAWIGTRIYFELQDFKKAKQYAKQYFLLKRNKKSEEYAELLEVYVSIEEKIIEQEEIEKEKQIEQRRIALENKKRDSLKLVWYNKVKELSIKADKIDPFNKYGNAIVSRNSQYGLINDKGSILIEPSKYTVVKSNGQLSLFLNKEENPTQILVYNHESGDSFELPKVGDFNLLSTHYGEVMLPRENGILVTYPDNSLKVFVYDINKKSVVSMDKSKEIIKELKKSDKIQKSNKEGQIRIDKQWYFYGGNLGGGIYPLISENYAVMGFLSATTGAVINSSSINYMGAFHDGLLQAKASEKSFWVNQSGALANQPESDLYNYQGETKVESLEEGIFYFVQNEQVIKKDEKMKLLEDYMKDQMNK